MKKKNYNPFKMWGSYVGAFIGAYLIIVFTTFGDVSKFTLGYINFPTFLIKLELFFNFVLEVFTVVLYSFLVFGIGFLIGWTIHSAIRTYVSKYWRKRNGKTKY